MSALNSATRLIVHSARNQERFSSARTKIIQRIVSRNEELSPVPVHLERKLFHLKPGWQLLNLTEKDWHLIALGHLDRDQSEQNLLNLTLSYIRTNRDRVLRLQKVSDLSSDVVLGADRSYSDGIISDLDAIDKQSLFVLRIQGGLHIDKFSELVDYIRSPENSSWLRGPFLYPFIYYALNTPADTFIDTYLSYMVPLGSTGGTQRQVIRHLLREDLSFDRSLGFRAYLALACHPYDAFDSLTSYYEMKLAQDLRLSPGDLDTLRQLADWFPDSRASRLLEYLHRRHSAPQLSEAVAHAVALSSRVPLQVRKLVSDFVDLDSACPELDALPNEQLRGLARMRWSKYPDETDFSTVTATARTWGFLDAGRLYSALCTSMYMLPRTQRDAEMRDAQRLHAFSGRATPFTWAAPQGYRLLRHLMNDNAINWLGLDLRTGVALEKRLNAEDRTWFSAVHWRLQRFEREVHVRKWLSEIRSRFQVKPRYLTGVDWSWIEAVLPVCRISPFREDGNGPFTLLLRDVEEQNRDGTLLRTAIEGSARGKSCDDFVAWLIGEYARDATAFVMSFLTPENILMLELAPNMTAALSERIAALERCAAELGFGELLTEDQLRTEQGTLSAALMLLNINANQFDIPWPAFRRDAGERQRDNYTSYLTFKRASKTLELASHQVLPYTYIYVNGRVVEYFFPSARLALGAFLIGVVDAFYDHPSYGLEAILSTRFRHDTLRREVKSSLDALETSYIAGVTRQEQKRILESLSLAALDAVDDWLARYMQTRRPGAPDAIFDMIPDAGTVTEMVTRNNASEDMDQALSLVQEWIEASLEKQLAAARDSFIQVCLSFVLAEVERAAADVREQENIDVEVLSKVVSGATSTLTRRFNDLLEWFKMPSGSHQPPLSYGQIKMAVDGRFEHPLSEERLAVNMVDDPRFSADVPPDSVKLIFDLLSELYTNCLKYADLAKTEMNIEAWGDMGDNWGLRITSAAGPSTEWIRDVNGHPYISISDAISREGNSGLEKVSSLAATLRGHAGSIIARRHQAAFELTIPLGTGP